MKIKEITALLLPLIAFASISFAQRQEIFHRNDYTLIVIYPDTTFNADTKNKMVETFFNVYPDMATRFNSEPEKQITFFIDTLFSNVAEADLANFCVRFNATWLKNYPEDYDVVTHEMMHFAQDYSSCSGPGWLVEGIADYGRHVFGVNNQQAGWAPSQYHEDQHYYDGYRVTANFLLWLEATIRTDIVDELDIFLKTQTYSETTWITLTGKPVEKLWELYAFESMKVTVNQKSNKTIPTKVR